MRSISGWRGLRKSARATPSAEVSESIDVSVPVPERTEKIIAWSGTPLSKASTRRPLTVACLFPPTQGGALVSWISAGGPGRISYNFV